MNVEFTPEYLKTLCEHPHLIGHLMGKSKLQPMHSKWILDTWLSPSHVCLQGHRGSYKTTAITEVGIIWWLLLHPDDRIALVRKPYEESVKTLAAIKNYFELPIIKELFRYAHGGLMPKMKRAREKSIIFNFKTKITKEGSIDAYGIDSSFTGSHYDKIICDDIVTLKDRISRAEREQTKLILQEILTNIIDPGKQVILNGTPWHKDDAYTILPPRYKYTIADTNLLSTEEIELKRRTITKVLFAINYDLKYIIDEDSIFSSPKYANWKYTTSRVYGHLDAKYQGDHTGALTFMARREDKKIQAIGFLFTENVKDKIKWIAELDRKYQDRLMYNEDNPDKGYTADFLKAEGLRVKPYHESMNKDIKIQTYLKRYWEEIEWDPNTDPEYMAQIIDYREGELPNDAPDSAASLLREAIHSKGADALWQA